MRHAHAHAALGDGRAAHADPVDFADEVEEFPLHLGEEADEPGHEVAAARGAFQKLHGVERDALAKLRLQAAADEFRDEHFVDDGADGQFDAVGRVVDAIERAGDFGDHGKVSGVRPGCS